MKTEQLTMAAAALARAAHPEWENFLLAFRLYAEGRRDELVKSPAELIHRTQGTAQACSALQALFEDAVKSADRIAQGAAMKTQR